MSELISRASRLAERQRSKLPRTFRADGKRFETLPIEKFRIELDVQPKEHLTIALESISSDAVGGAALVELRALSINGTRLAITGWDPISARVGEYQYLEAAEPGRLALTTVNMRMPKEAVRLEVVGHRWKAAISTAIVASPVINRSSQPNWSFETPTGAALEHRASAIDLDLPIPPGSRRFELSIEHVARDEDSSGPISVTLRDADGIELLPIPSLPQHRTLGPIVQLSGNVGERKTKLLKLEVPSRAATVHLRGADWGDKTAHISGTPKLTPIDADEVSVEAFVASIPRDEELIVIDTTAPPMGHATLGLRPNNLSLSYERAGRWVVFLPFSSLQEFSHRQGDRLFQVPRSEVGALWDALRTHRAGTSDIYICSSFPSAEAVTAAYDLKRLGWTVVYEVRDDMEEFNRVGYSKWYTPILEQQMLGLADRVVSVSRALDEKMVSMQPRIGQHAVIPNGVRSAVIDANAGLRSSEAAERRRDSRTVGYVGHLTDSWFDWPMLRGVAERMPDVRFEIVGHGMPEGLELPDNLVYLGPKTHDELRDMIGHWKVGIIPFLDIPLTRSVDPNKIYEYFAWGLRCVTVEMGAVSDYPWTRVYRDAASFIAELRWALETPVTQPDLSELEAFVGTIDWDSRAAQMLRFIERGVV